jgi:type II secretory pathway pseudopilin PulG
MPSSSARGFTYIGVLVIVAIMGIMLAAVGRMWQTYVAREREEELLFVGDQYRRAIELYFKEGLDKNRQQQGAGRYPRELADLVKDPRWPDTRRYLRKLYPDPVTGKNEWGLVKSPDGGIAGVYSLSEAAPFKTAGFKVRYAAFEGKQKYAEWQFIFAGIQAAPGAKPAAAGAPAAPGAPGALGAPAVPGAPPAAGPLPAPGATPKPTPPTGS